MKAIQVHEFGVFSNNLGSYLFIHVFHNKLAPQVVLSAGFTAFAFVLVPLLCR